MAKNKITDIRLFILKIVLFAVLLVYALSLVIPIIWTFLTSLKSQVEYSTYNVNGLPQLLKKILTN